jgi:hypothetical protein
MLQSLSRSYALLRIVYHHLIHEVDGCVPSCGNQLVQRSRHELREREINSRCQLVTFRPLSLGRATQYSADLVDLVSLTVSREEGSLEIKLSHDSSHGKHIYG